MDILEKFAKSWRENIALPAGTIVLAACSGGIDSLALLDMLEVMQARLGIRVAAAHFEHGIRGQASLEDAAFVEAFCRRRGIDCYIAHANVPEEAARAGESLETAARRLRYDFLRRTAQELGHHGGRENKVVAATAHHREDQAETVLMHLLRGSGVRGLGGIKISQEGLIRPLLFAHKAELAAYCRERGLEPRYDATNDEPDCLRNKLRLELLPLLAREYNPAVGDALCQLAELAGADEDYLQQSVEKLWQALVVQSEHGFCCNCRQLLQQHPAMQLRLVQYMAFQAAGGRLPYVQVQSVAQLVKKGRTGSQVQLSFGLLAKISYDFLYIEKKTIPFSENNGTMDNVGDFEKIPLCVPGVTRLPDGSCIVAELMEMPPRAEEFCGALVSEAPDISSISDSSGNCSGNDSGAGWGRWAVYGDWDRCRRSLAVRHRRRGDRVNVGSGHKKLKDFLIDSRIPRQQRDRLWLVTCGSGEEERILWLPGVRRFAEAAAEAQTKKFFVLRLERQGKNL